jgi:CHAD domain-containing protein
MHSINPHQSQEIHKFRILAKKLRYQEECLNSMTGSSRFNIDNLKSIQSLAGQIQNDSVLLETLGRYLSKRKNQGDTHVTKITNRVKSHRAKIINTDFTKLSLNRKIAELEK